MRAVAQDKTMAALLGINIDTVISVTFIIGSGLAAVAGLMVAMYYGLVNYFIGYIAGIKAFTAAVLGGIGSIRGAMVGGILLGLVESLGGSYISGEYKDAYAFIILIVILLIKPGGLLLYDTNGISRHPARKDIDIYKVEAPDGIEPIGSGAKTIMRYAENNISAGIGYRGKYKLVIFGFPFETIPDEKMRHRVMKGVLLYFGSPR